MKQTIFIYIYIYVFILLIFYTISFPARCEIASLLYIGVLC